MVYRQGVMPDPCLHSPAHGEFVRMDLAAQAMPRSGLKNALSLRRLKESFIAENIHIISEFRRLRHHIYHRLHILALGVSSAHPSGFSP